MLLFNINCIFAQVGIATTSPDAQLDIRSSSQTTPSITDGILIPKINTFSVTNPTIAQQGMLVYLNAPTTFGGNPKAIGFYYWDFATLDWIGISSSSNGDHDWYEEGTTLAPNTITDDMFHTGNVAIGKNTTDFPLEVQNTTLDRTINATSVFNLTNAITKYGLNNSITGSSNDVLNGISNSVITTGTSSNIGITNVVTNPNSASLFGISNFATNSFNGNSTGISNSALSFNGTAIAVDNSVNSSGTGVSTGVNNTINSVGTGIQYGVRNTMNNTGLNTKYGILSDLSGVSSLDQFGVRNNISVGGDGVKYGVYNNMTSTTGNGIMTGTVNAISATGNGIKYGVHNIISGSGSGANYGTYNSVFGSNTNVNFGTNNEMSSTTNSNIFGTSNYINASGIGIKYGTYSLINSGSGGTHYGVYSEVLKVGATNFAGYFLGNVGIGTTTANTYTFPPSRGINNQIMVSNGTGIVSWQNPSFIQDHDWYEVGTVLAPDAITDSMFHSGNVSIGKNTNTYPLDVTSATRTINSVTTNATSSSILGTNSAASGSGSNGHGVAGYTNQSNSFGVYGENYNANGFAITGYNLVGSGAGGGTGIYGVTSQSAGFGMFSRNLNTSGTGLISSGTNSIANYLTSGSGGAFTGLGTGIYGYSTTAGIGEAIYSNQFGNITRVNYWSGFTQYKIIGAGTVSTIAKGLDDEKVVLHCTEAPEIYFEDYGQGQLLNGNAHIEIDPIIAKNITVNYKHPLRVYIQLEDNCNGVFVTNKTGSSFDVKELASGQSNAKFQYHIVGNRADEVLPNGRISRNADARFEPAPKDHETKEAKSVAIGKPTTLE